MESLAEPSNFLKIVRGNMVAVVVRTARPRPAKTRDPKNSDIPNAELWDSFTVEPVVNLFEVLDPNKKHSHGRVKNSP